MDYRTPLERELQELLVDLEDTLRYGKQDKQAYVRLLGHVRDVRVRLDNLKFGCQTGLHSGACYCDAGIPKAKIIKREVA